MGGAAGMGDEPASEDEASPSHICGADGAPAALLVLTSRKRAPLAGRQLRYTVPLPAGVAQRT